MAGCSRFGRLGDRRLRRCARVVAHLLQPGEQSLRAPPGRRAGCGTSTTLNQSDSSSSIAILVPQQQLGVVAGPAGAGDVDHQPQRVARVVGEPRIVVGAQDLEARQRLIWAASVVGFGDGFAEQRRRLRGPSSGGWRRATRAADSWGWWSAESSARRGLARGSPASCGRRGPAPCRRASRASCGSFGRRGRRRRRARAAGRRAAGT